MIWAVLRDNINTYFKNESDYTYIFPINKNNFFVGKNNSGKSRFLRFIMKNTIRIYTDEKHLIDELCNSITNNKNNFKKIQTTGICELDSIINKYNEYIKMVDKIKTSTGNVRGQIIGKATLHYYNNVAELIKDTKPLMDYLGLTTTSDGTGFDTSILPKEKEIKEKITDQLLEDIIKYVKSVNVKDIHKFGKLYNILDVDPFNNSQIKAKYYIPTIRGLRNPLKDIKEKSTKEDIYMRRVASEYTIDKDDINIISGLDLYSVYKNNLLGNKEKRSRTANFEKFLSEYFFDGAEISIVPDEDTFELKINIDDDENDRFIYEVGDGISSLIIFIYTMFIESSKDKWNLFFIDEPENSFHPGFQRLLINIISNYQEFEKCICFFSTHSNHLIDIGTREMQNSNVYLCKQNNHNTEICYQDDEFNEVLDELGVQASSVRIANKVIWVEGKYDAFYIRLLLKLHEAENGKKYIEDYDYCFVPYGGANMKLIDFTSEKSERNNDEFITKAKIINNKFLVILDDDEMGNDTKSEKYKRYQRLKEKLKDKIYKLNVREIENLFPEKVVQTFIKDGMIDKSKVNNLKINYNDYKNTKLGGYINKLIKNEYETEDLKSITGRTEGFETNHLLYNKSKFYDAVLKWSKTENFNYERDLPTEAKQLVDTVETFISN